MSKNFISQAHYNLNQERKGTETYLYKKGRRSLGSTEGENQDPIYIGVWEGAADNCTNSIPY